MVRYFQRARKAVLLIVVVLFIVAGYGAEAADDAMDFFKGKVVEFIVPYSMGGGYDSIARALAPVMEKYLPGAKIIVKNVTGGGGLVGTNKLYAARPDGLTIGIMNTAGVVFNQALESPDVKYDVTQFSWLGRVTSEPHVIKVGGKSPFKSVDDLRKAGRPIVFSSQGVGDDDHFGQVIVFNALGIPLKNILGFPGATEATLAAVRGDVDGTSTSYSSGLALTKSGDMRVILQITLERDPRMAEVPTVLEVAPKETHFKAKAIASIFSLDRTVAGPPGIPADRLEALRQAFKKAVEDQAYVEWALKSERPVMYMSGDALKEFAKETMELARQIKADLEGALKAGQ